MEICLVIGAIAATALISLAIADATKKHRAAQLAELARRLNGARVLPGDSAFGGLDGTSLKGGTWDGHAVEVRYSVRGSGNNKVTTAEVRIPVREPIPGFRIRPAGVLNRLGRWLGVVQDTKTGDERIDDTFILDGRPDALSSLFAQPEAERALNRIFGGEGGSEVSLRGGALIAPVRVAGTDIDKVMIVVRSLAALAKLCDRKPIEIKVKGKAQETRRFAWTGGTDQALCPYCRDGVDPDGGLELSACGSCQTVHHAECLQEAGGCTVFGCGGGRSRASA